MKLRYTKAQLEDLIFIQIGNLHAQAEQIRLLEEQNELLLRANHKIAERLSSQYKKLVPYPSSKRPKPVKSKNKIIEFPEYD